MAESEPKEATEAPTPGRSGKVVVLAVLVATLGTGALAGQRLVGPGLGAALANRAPAAGGHEGEVAQAMYVVDNLVVNPAGSGGSRFLLTSVAIEAATAEVAADLVLRDVEIRDAFTLVLGSRTVESLSDIAQRAALTRELRVAVEGLLGPGSVRRVLIPQFVIQ